MANKSILKEDDVLYLEHLEHKDRDHLSVKKDKYELYFDNGSDECYEHIFVFDKKEVKSPYRVYVCEVCGFTKISFYSFNKIEEEKGEESDGNDNRGESYTVFSDRQAGFRIRKRSRGLKTTVDRCS